MWIKREIPLISGSNAWPIHAKKLQNVRLIRRLIQETYNSNSWNRKLWILKSLMRVELCIDM